VSPNLQPGAYRLSANLYGSDRSLLRQSSFIVFIGTSSPTIASVSIYPPAAESGEALLLELEFNPDRAAAAQESDPWIRWSKEGYVFAEGLRSKGLDRVVWTAPRIEGAYALLVEVFPAAPPDAGGFPFRSRIRQEFKAMVKAKAGVEDEFADPMLFSSLLRLDGNFDDIGTRARSAAPSPSGTPRLDVYPGGFGYRFGEKAGLNLPGLMPPSSNGQLSDFSVLFRLAADGGDGSLVRFMSEDGSFTMKLGLKQYRPFVELVSGGKTTRSVASDPIPQDPMTLVASFSADGDRLDIVWHAEGRRIRTQSLNLPSVPSRGGASIGGHDSLAGVYDAFGVMRRGAPAAFRIASERGWKSKLVIAEGFEDGLLPPGANTGGGARILPGKVELPEGGSIRLEHRLNLGKHLAFEAELSGDIRSAVLDFESSEGVALFSILGTGEVVDGGGEKLGSLKIQDGRLRLGIDPAAEGSRVNLSQGGDPLAVPLATGLEVGLNFRNEGAQAALFLERVSVRESQKSSGSRP
jgi:hypothetical protein